eukprot:scaffold986_cov237-Pinguiococcus_pyrenoidosus.AAC.9
MCTHISYHAHPHLPFPQQRTSGRSSVQKSGPHRAWIRQASGLDHYRVEGPRASGHQHLQRVHQLVLHAAAHAAIGHFHDFLRLSVDSVPRNDALQAARVSEVVLHHCDAQPMIACRTRRASEATEAAATPHAGATTLQNPAQETGFATAEETGQDGHGHASPLRRSRRLRRWHKLRDVVI